MNRLLLHRDHDRNERFNGDQLDKLRLFCQDARKSRRPTLTNTFALLLNERRPTLARSDEGKVHDELGRYWYWITFTEQVGDSKQKPLRSVKGSAGAAGAVAGAVVGGALLGPVGAAVGGLLGCSAEVDKTCDRCDGKGTRNPRNWHSFGGKQMTMYHGTSSSNAASIRKQGFKQSTDGMLGPGVYLSADRDKACGYGDTVLEVDVRLGKTKKITSQSDPMRSAWSSSGYDSAWVPEGRFGPHGDMRL
ncbi:unnamed protein product [Symbiodinium microadriaticum]|nr:unnamed protein product [Symbiodinium microadriaticum]